MKVSGGAEGRPMPARRLKIEIQDQDGTRYTFTAEGRLTREKLLKLVEMVNLVGGSLEEDVIWGAPPPPSEMTLFEKIQLVIEKYFPDTWFTSRDVQMAYRGEYGEPVKLSTVSTYLARMAERGWLMRTGPSSSRRYRLAAEPVKAIPRAY